MATPPPPPPVLALRTAVVLRDVVSRWHGSTSRARRPACRWGRPGAHGRPCRSRRSASWWPPASTCRGTARPTWLPPSCRMTPGYGVPCRVASRRGWCTLPSRARHLRTHSGHSGAWRCWRHRPTEGSCSGSHDRLTGATAAQLPPSPCRPMPPHSWYYTPRHRDEWCTTAERRRSAFRRTDTVHAMAVEGQHLHVHHQPRQNVHHKADAVQRLVAARHPDSDVDEVVIANRRVEVALCTPYDIGDTSEDASDGQPARVTNRRTWCGASTSCPSIDTACWCQCGPRPCPGMLRRLVASRGAAGHQTQRHRAGRTRGSTSALRRRRCRTSRACRPSRACSRQRVSPVTPTHTAGTAIQPRVMTSSRCARWRSPQPQAQPQLLRRHCRRFCHWHWSSHARRTSNGTSSPSRGSSLSLESRTLSVSGPWPRLYFRLKNFDSSISTMIGSPFASNPPSWIGWRRTSSEQTSRTKFPQSTRVCHVRPSCQSVDCMGTSMDQWYMMQRMSFNWRCDRWKNVEVRMLRTAPQPEHRHRHPSTLSRAISVYARLHWPQWCSLCSKPRAASRSTTGRALTAAKTGANWYSPSSSNSKYRLPKNYQLQRKSPSSHEWDRDGEQ